MPIAGISSLTFEFETHQTYVPVISQVFSLFFLHDRPILAGTGQREKVLLCGRKV